MDKVVCAISLDKADGEIFKDEKAALETDFRFFLEPYLIEFLKQPDISDKNKNVFAVTFICPSSMQETIESFLLKTMDYTNNYRITTSFDKV